MSCYVVKLFIIIYYNTQGHEPRDMVIMFISEVEKYGPWSALLDISLISLKFLKNISLT